MYSIVLTPGVDEDRKDKRKGEGDDLQRAVAAVRRD